MEKYSTVILQMFNAISVSSILLLIALGLAITFGLMKIINMAHGEFIMIGAYVTYMIQNFFEKNIPESLFDSYYILSLPLAFIVTALIGYILEITVIRHLYGRPLDSLLATWGVSLFLQQLARTIFGAPNVDVESPSWLTGGLVLAEGLQLPYKRIYIIALVGVCLLGTYLFFYHTNQGMRMRAVMQNRVMASCLGISVRRLDAFTFAFGCGLAGIAGYALTLIGSIGPTLGTGYIVDAFMVVVLGGVGKLVGTVAGAATIGMGNVWFEYFTGTSMAKVLIFTVVIIFLQFKPKGLFVIHSRDLED